MPIEVTSETFEREVVHSDKPVLVDFWGPQCAPCLALMPHVEQLEQTYGAKIKITKIDASKNRRLCLQLKVMGLPTFLFYAKGEGIARLTGQDLQIRDIEDQIRKII